jgi:TRAP-type C4-dicarboxylate transport system permease large subunit
LLILVIMLGVFIALGCIMDSLSMILLTIPIFWPVLAALDFGLPPDDLQIWFGIIALIVVEMGLITPPIGMNVFIVNGLAHGVPMRETFKGILPFMVSDLIRVAILLAFPSISLLLPRLLN